jgi:hypothetical protein
MAEQDRPNQNANKSKAEGERWAPETPPVGAGPDERQRGDSGEAGGITNRPLNEETENQDAVPERGESKPGAHAGHGDDDRRSER